MPCWSTREPETEQQLVKVSEELSYWQWEGPRCAGWFVCVGPLLLLAPDVGKCKQFGGSSWSS